MSLTWLLIGIIIGLFLPAPYDAIARNAFANLWVWLKSFFTK